MIVKIKKFIFAVAVTCLIFPALVFAQVGSELNGRGGNTGSPAGSPGTATDELCQGDFQRINGLCVPKPKGNVGGLIGTSTIFEVVTIVLKWLFTLAGIIASVFVIIGGYQYMTSAGNEEAAEKGKKTLINALIGLVAVLLAISIVTIITNTLGSDNLVGFLLRAYRA